MSPQYFTTLDTWNGGFYELGLDFGLLSDEDIAAAFARLWAHPDLEGCYLDRDREPADQIRIPPDWTLFATETPHLYGVARVPGGQRVACGSYHMGDYATSRRFSLYLPLGALSEIYPIGGYPFGSYEQAPLWIPQLESWLADIGRWVYEAVPFRLGLIGHEAAGEVDADDLISVPTTRYFSYLWPQDGALQYFPATSTG